ncbi:carboxylesterase/lipase family protein [Nocardia sp. NPDC050630]|uniref:carboxylesterase/lipase family protein n=1 Tax=Nocardia sp. NPDC050630 TaxID=3364321 RepID=UPI0037B2BF28
MTTTEFPETRTATGLVRGRREEGLAVFRGIPFAQPPVGELRFTAPKPVEGWDGVREAFAFGPPPPQEPMLPPTDAPADVPAGDDWLTINVWSPEADPAARRPVMVWIHGGACKFGSADDPTYDASRLARDGELVVVTFNYRVGMEGFAQLEGAPANRGLLDQVAALEWVRENIAAFGGDPNQVTLFGESAGAATIAALMAMPRARGLFSRAIAQSVPGTFLSPELAADIAGVLAGELGLGPTVSGLAGVDPHKLAAGVAAVSTRMPQYAGRWGTLAHTPTAYAHVIDGDVLPVAPWQALAEGAAREVDLLVGHTRDEFRTFLGLGGLFGQIGDDLAAMALNALAPVPDAVQAYRAAYPGVSAEGLFELVHSDWLFRMPSLHLAQAHAAGGGRAHLYEITWSTPVSGGALGACHGVDLPLVFGSYSGGFGQLLIGEPTPETEALSSRFRSIWTTFAATGDPGWPAYDAESRLTQLIDTDLTVTRYPEEASHRLWQNHTFAALPLVADAG